MALETYTVQIEAEITKAIAGISLAKAALLSLGLAADGVSNNVQNAINQIANIQDTFTRRQASILSSLNEIGKKVQDTFKETAAVQEANAAEVAAVVEQNNKRIIVAETRLRDLRLVLEEETTAAKAAAAARSLQLEESTQEGLASILGEFKVARIAAAEAGAAEEIAAATRVADIKKAIAAAEDNLETFRTNAEIERLDAVKAAEESNLAFEAEAVAKRTALYTQASNQEAALTELRISNAEKEEAAQAGLAAATAETFDKIQLATTALQGVFAAIDVAAIGLIARALTEVGDKLLEVATKTAETSGEFQLFEGIVKNALDRANEATGNTTGTFQEFNATIKQTSELFGAAQVDVARTTARILELQPSLGLTTSQLKNVITAVTVLGVQFHDQGRVLTDFADAFEKLPLPIRRLIGADVTAAATQKELTRIMAEGGDQAERLTSLTQEQQRVQAVYNILIRASAPYIKTFQEQQDNAALASRRLEAAMLDLINRFGAFTGPVVSAAIEATRSFIQSTIALPDTFFAIAAGITLVVGSFAKLTGVILEGSLLIGVLVGSTRALAAVLAFELPLGLGTISSQLSTFFTNISAIDIAIIDATSLFRAFGLSVLASLTKASIAIEVFLESVVSLNIAVGGLTALFEGFGVQIGLLLASLARIAGYLAVLVALASALYEVGKTIAEVAPTTNALTTSVDSARNSISAFTLVMQELKMAGSLVTSVLATGFLVVLTLLDAVLLGTVTTLKAVFESFIVLGTYLRGDFVTPFSQRVKEASNQLTALSGAQKTLVVTGSTLIDATKREAELTAALAFNMLDAKDAALIANTAFKSLGVITKQQEAALLGAAGAFVFWGEKAGTLIQTNYNIATAVLTVKERLDLLSRTLQDEVKAEQDAGTARIAASKAAAEERILDIDRTILNEKQAKDAIANIHIEESQAIIAEAEKTYNHITSLIENQKKAEIASAKETTDATAQADSKLLSAASEAGAKAAQLNEQNLTKYLNILQQELKAQQDIEAQKVKEVQAANEAIRKIQLDADQQLFDLTLAQNEDLDAQLLDQDTATALKNYDIQKKIADDLEQAHAAVAQGDYNLANDLIQNAKNLSGQLKETEGQDKSYIIGLQKDVIQETANINKTIQQQIKDAGQATADAAQQAAAATQAKLNDVADKLSSVIEEIKTARLQTLIEILPDSSKLKAELQTLKDQISQGPNVVFVPDLTQVNDAIANLQSQVIQIPAQVNVATADIPGGSIHPLDEAAATIFSVLTPEPGIPASIAVQYEFPPHTLSEFINGDITVATQIIKQFQLDSFGYTVELYNYAAQKFREGLIASQDALAKANAQFFADQKKAYENFANTERQYFLNNPFVAATNFYFVFNGKTYRSTAALVADIKAGLVALTQLPISLRATIKTLVDVPGGSLYETNTAGAAIMKVIQNGINLAQSRDLGKATITADSNQVITKFLQAFHYIASTPIPVKLIANSIDIKGGSIHDLTDAAEVIKKIINPGVIQAQLALTGANVPIVPQIAPSSYARPFGTTVGTQRGTESKITVDLRMNDTSYPVDVINKKSAETLVAFAKQLKQTTRTSGEFVSPYKR